MQILPILSNMNFDDFHIHYVDYQDTIPVVMWESNDRSFIWLKKRKKKTLFLFGYGISKLTQFFFSSRHQKMNSSAVA